MSLVEENKTLRVDPESLDQPASVDETTRTMVFDVKDFLRSRYERACSTGEQKSIAEFLAGLAESSANEDTDDQLVKTLLDNEDLFMQVLETLVLASPSTPTKTTRAKPKVEIGRAVCNSAERTSILEDIQSWQSCSSQNEKEFESALESETPIAARYSPAPKPECAPQQFYPPTVVLHQTADGSHCSSRGDSLHVFNYLSSPLARKLDPADIISKPYNHMPRQMQGRRQAIRPVRENFKPYRKAAMSRRSRLDSPCVEQLLKFCAFGMPILTALYAAATLCYG